MFPLCKKTYTSEDTLNLHMQNQVCFPLAKGVRSLILHCFRPCLCVYVCALQHPEFYRENLAVASGNVAQQSSDLDDDSSGSGDIEIVSKSEAAVRMTLSPSGDSGSGKTDSGDALPTLDPSKSLYSAFLLGPGGDSTDEYTSDDQSSSPLVRRHLGKSSADAKAAVEAAKAARRREQEQQQQQTPQKPPESLAQNYQSQAQRSGFEDNSDDDFPDEVPDEIPDFDDDEDVSAAPAAAPAPSGNISHNSATQASSTDNSTSTNASASPFSASALANARKAMKAPPTTKGVTLTAPRRPGWSQFIFVFIFFF